MIEFCASILVAYARSSSFILVKFRPRWTRLSINGEFLSLGSFIRFLRVVIVWEISVWFDESRG